MQVLVITSLYNYNYTSVLAFTCCMQTSMKNIFLVYTQFKQKLDSHQVSAYILGPCTCTSFTIGA